MNELDDSTLLREYVERDSEQAFATLVARHVNKVYSVAWRHTRNTHQAQEITQAVFVTLAKKSRELSQSVVLSGWLYQTARLTAVTFIRSEIRRGHREQEAYMQTFLNEPEPDPWPQIAPLLDVAMAGLNDTDRHAVVLRFFDGKSLKEVGVVLGASEDAAKMRLSRAVEKLRLFFQKRGIVLTDEGLTDAISLHAVEPAPADLAKLATTAALTKGASTLSAAVKGGAMAKSAITSGVAGLLLSPLLIVFGQYLNYRTSLDATHSAIERRHLKALYRKIFLVVAGLFIPCAAILWWLGGRQYNYSVLWEMFPVLAVIYILTLLAFVAGSIPKQRDYLVHLEAQGDPMARQKPAWEYRSRASFLGLPLVHIRFGDRFDLLHGPVKAWIALGGHCAIGGLFAWGMLAVAPVSMGGVAIGLVPFGGIALGGFALGAVTFGILTFGALAFGYWSVGACAIGWNAAYGNVALAHDNAMGSIARAAAANTDAAAQAIQTNPFMQWAQFVDHHAFWLILFSVLPIAIHWVLLKRRHRLSTHNS